jgi:ADP-ribose pyrophosphatase
MPSKKAVARKQPSIGKKNAKSKVKVLSSRVVYRAPVFYVTSEQVIEPSGATVRRDLVRHPGSVVIMALDETDAEAKVLLARQFRYAAGESLWEFPAGRIDPGEETIFAARRELEEETGYTAQRWTLALFFYSSPGFLDETMALFLARDLKRGKARPEDDEFITKRLFSIPQAVNMVMNGSIRDAKTIAGVLWIQEWLKRRGCE